MAEGTVSGGLAPDASDEMVDDEFAEKAFVFGSPAAPGLIMCQWIRVSFHTLVHSVEKCRHCNISILDAASF